MTPLPPLSKVFSLVIQRSISYGLNSNSLNFCDPNASATASSVRPTSNSPASALASNYNATPKRDRPLCSHCGCMQGHTIDKCYKLHGCPHPHPPGSKPKLKPTPTKANANQALSAVNEGSASSGASLSSLTPSQCQQLIALLSS